MRGTDFLLTAISYLKTFLFNSYFKQRTCKNMVFSQEKLKVAQNDLQEKQQKNMRFSNTSFIFLHKNNSFRRDYVFKYPLRACHILFPPRKGVFSSKTSPFWQSSWKSQHSQDYMQQLNMQKQGAQISYLQLKHSKNRKRTLQGSKKGKRNKNKPQSKRKIGYWRNSQQLKYLTFLDLNYLIMKNAQLRSELQIFKKMAAFIRSRDPVQCKSHHQKMLMKNKNSLECIMKQQNTSDNTRPEYIYRQQCQDGNMRHHLTKIETSEELPYFMIQQPARLLIVIDQRFMISY